MEPNTLLRLDRIELKNFRCFKECVLELDPKLTVLVAENGAGKTALLDAMQLSLRPYLEALSGDAPSEVLKLTDIRVEKNARNLGELRLPVAADIQGFIDHQAVRCGVRRIRENGQFSEETEGLSFIRDKADALRRADADEGLEVNPENNLRLLPVFAYFGNRRMEEEDEKLEPGTKLDRFGQFGMSSRKSATFTANSLILNFLPLYFTSEENVQEKTRQFFWHNAREVAQRCASILLRPSAISSISWNPMMEMFLADGKEISLPFTLSSDGVRLILGFVVDLAVRCSRINLHLGERAAELTPGILLIDEVDLHLHPRWQQQIVPLLQEAFPNLQIVVTTHSPHVLSSVDKKHIRVIHLEDGVAHIETPQFQTKGVESSTVLAQIMGVDPVPPVAEADMLRNYTRLIQEYKGETQEALTLRNQLTAHFGEMHPVMLEAEQLASFYQFKAQQKAKAEAVKMNRIEQQPELALAA